MANNFEPVLITSTDLLRLSYCSIGTRLWFRRVGLDWDQFLAEGLMSDEVEAVTDDAMAIELINKVRKMKGIE